MTTNINSLPGRSPRTFWIVFVTSAFVVTMIVGATLATTPRLGLMPSAAPPTARPLSWAAAEIAKPTYTPSPSPVPTFTPTTPPTPTIMPSATESPLEMSTVSDPVDLPAPDAQSSDAASSGKYILVSISQQHLYAYENGQLVYSFIASTGMGNSTRTGHFSVLDKIPNAYGSTWDIWMPNWMGIYYAGTLEDGIHALPILPSGARLWSGFLGTPISFGCVVLGVSEADQLYNWADVGTPVEIRW
jgi:lipoprotein-anchoring transpeptidase ErfK/SrfK